MFIYSAASITATIIAIMPHAIHADIIVRILINTHADLA